MSDISGSKLRTLADYQNCFHIVDMLLFRNNILYCWYQKASTVYQALKDIKFLRRLLHTNRYVVLLWLHPLEKTIFFPLILFINYVITQNWILVLQC